MNVTEIEVDEPDRLRRADCAAALRISGVETWLRHRFGNFALPAGTDERGPFWYLEEVYRWAAASGEQRLVRAAPLRAWPTAEQPAEYWGTRELQGCVVQFWDTTAGMIAVMWTVAGQWHKSAHDILDELPEVDVLVRVQSDFGIDGPGLSTVQRRGPDEWDDFGMRWHDLSRILGQPAPYWPYMLRIARLITDWKPGAAAVTYPTIPEVDTTPLLRLAATMPPDSPTYQALLHLVTVTQERSTTGAISDLEILAQCLARVGHREAPPEETTAVAAVPLPVPEPVDEDRLDLAVIRAGWMDVLNRTDQLAAECVVEAAKWDGGSFFPHASVEEVDPASQYGAEWCARLEPVVERKAVYWRLGDGDREAFVDPECDAPVVRKDNGKLLVAVPQRLPTTEPLTEVILDTPIWVRTEDGTLYPAPRNEYFGLSWGYGGSGPGSLALLIHRLLVDTTAPGADDINGAPDGLEELTQLDWPHGTVLSREVLEAARDGRPYDKP